jgi:hypothetical protein
MMEPTLEVRWACLPVVFSMHVLALAPGESRERSRW